MSFPASTDFDGALLAGPEVRIAEALSEDGARVVEGGRGHAVERGSVR